MVDRLSTPSATDKCLSVPKVYTVPPNKFNYTVSLVAMLPSIIPAISWLAKTFKGFYLKSFTENTLF